MTLHRSLAAPALVAALALSVRQHASAQDTLPNAAAVARARADSVRYPWTAADALFMSSMIGHHAQAIVMSRLVPTHGANAAVQRLAERIINAQQDEITTMQRWLRSRGQPVPSAHPDSGGHAMHHTTLMSGMLTDAQLHELGQARGAEFDRLFLRGMIQHHRGAVAMVNALFATHAAGQDETVFKFASDVQIDQITEISRMQRLLVALTLGLPVE